MKAYETLLPQSLPLSIALGYFDGIHKGHREVISQAVKMKSKGLTPAVFTFRESPRVVLFEAKEERITDNETKVKVFESLGVEVLFMIDFAQVKNLTPRQFVRDILKEKLNVKYAVCGFNYHFGHGGVGDANELSKLCAENEIKTKIVKPVLYKREPISSSRIRKALRENDAAAAKKMLFK